MIIGTLISVTLNFELLEKAKIWIYPNSKETICRQTRKMCQIIMYRTHEIRNFNILEKNTSYLKFFLIVAIVSYTEKFLSLSTLFPLYDQTQRKEEMKSWPEFLMISVPIYQVRFWEAVIPLHQRVSDSIGFREPVSPTASVSSVSASENRWLKKHRFSPASWSAIFAFALSSLNRLSS